jgi:hypothetical protein
MGYFASASSTRWTGLSLRGITSVSETFTDTVADLNGTLTSDKNSQWERLTSASNPIATSGGLSSVAATNQNIIYQVNRNFPTGTITLEFPNTNCGQNAVYLRIQDANNWLRVVTYASQGSTYSVCGLQYNGVYYYTDNDGNCFGISSSANPATETSTRCGSQIVTTYNSWAYRPDCYSVTVWSLVAYTYYDYSEVYSTVYPLNQFIALQRCVGGVVSTLDSTSVQTSGFSGFPSTEAHSIVVSYSPTSVSYTRTGSSFATRTVATTDFSDSYKVGFGRANVSSTYTGAQATSFSVVS